MLYLQTYYGDYYDFTFHILLINIFSLWNDLYKVPIIAKSIVFNVEIFYLIDNYWLKYHPYITMYFCCHWLSDQITSVSEFLFLSSNISPFIDWPNNVIIEISLIMGTINVNILQTKLAIEKYCQAFILEHLIWYIWNLMCSTHNIFDDLLKFLSSYEILKNPIDILNSKFCIIWMRLVA